MRLCGRIGVNATFVLRASSINVPCRLRAPAVVTCVLYACVQVVNVCHVMRGMYLISYIVVKHICCLTLARTCYFPILERTWGAATPHVISPLIEIELWCKNQTNPWDVLSPMVSELTFLGHILTPPGRVKLKKIAI